MLGGSAGSCDTEEAEVGRGSDGRRGGASEGEDGEVSLPLLQSSVECVSVVYSAVGSGGSAVCPPESRVWQRPRGRSLGRGPASRLAEGLLTSTVSPRLNLLLSGFTWEVKITDFYNFIVTRRTGTTGWMKHGRSSLGAWMYNVIWIQDVWRAAQWHVKPKMADFTGL